MIKYVLLLGLMFILIGCSFQYSPMDINGNSNTVDEKDTQTQEDQLTPSLQIPATAL